MRAFAPPLHGPFRAPVLATTTSPLTLLFSGGGRGIRTPERVTPLTVFKTAAFNHSAIPPTTILADFTIPLPELAGIETADACAT